MQTIQASATEIDRPQEITEDRDQQVVTIDGYQLPGGISKLWCPVCCAPQIYSTDYDAFFCPACNVWLETNCGDPGCQYCHHRPARPLPCHVEG